MIPGLRRRRAANTAATLVTAPLPPLRSRLKDSSGGDWVVVRHVSSNTAQLRAADWREHLLDYFADLLPRRAIVIAVAVGLVLWVAVIAFIVNRLLQ